MPAATKSVQDIANIFSVDVSTVARWVSIGCPSKKVSGNRLFDESAVAAWMKANNKTGKPGRTKVVTAASIEIEAARLRKENALAVKYERENELAAAWLIDGPEEARRDADCFAIVAARLARFSTEVPPQLVGKDAPEAQTIIDGAVEEVLKQLSGK